MSIHEIQNYINFDLKQVSKITTGKIPHPYAPFKPKELGNIPVFVWFFNDTNLAQEFDMGFKGILGLGILENDYLSGMTSIQSSGNSLIYPLYQLPKGTFSVFDTCRCLVEAKLFNHKEKTSIGFYIMTCIAGNLFKQKDLLNTLINSPDEFVEQKLSEAIDAMYKSYECNVLTQGNDSGKPC